MFVEFMGPPGSGKSTILSKIISQSELPIYSYEDYIGQYTIQNTKRHYKPIYHLFPKFIKNAEYIHRKKAFDTFISEYPDFMNNFFRCASTAKREIQLFKWCRAGAERYQIGIESKSENEIFILNESFHQLGVHILTESKSTSNNYDNISKYLEVIPKPDLVVYITADSSTCLQRQKKRDRVVPSPHAMPKDHPDLLSIQQEFQKNFLSVFNKIDSESDVNCIKLSNMGDINEPVSILNKKLIDLYSPI